MRVIYGSSATKSVSKGARYDSHAAEETGIPMSWLMRAAAALAWIGRQGTRAVALSVFAGLALPWLAAAAEPASPRSRFVLLCLAFLRVRMADLRGHVRRPGLVLAVLAWMMIATPLAAGL